MGASFQPSNNCGLLNCDPRVSMVLMSAVSMCRHMHTPVDYRTDFALWPVVTASL
jgi:hypothetical protein